jgi:nitroreductase
MSANPVTDFLLKRRSVVAKKMIPEKIDADHLNTILDCAIRVPDHSNVKPWRITVFEDEARSHFDQQVIYNAAKKRSLENNEPMTEALEQLEQTRMQRSGTVVCVLFKPVIPHKIPLWEQQLSCGAVCSQMLIAAQSFGYAAQWITEWIAYDAMVIAAVGGNPASDLIAGFIHIGSMDSAPTERKRPVRDEIIQYWQAS